MEKMEKMEIFHLRDARVLEQVDRQISNFALIATSTAECLFGQENNLGVRM